MLSHPTYNLLKNLLALLLNKSKPDSIALPNCFHPSTSQHFLQYPINCFCSYLIAVCSSENNQIDPFRKEIGSCHFPVLYSSMAFNHTLNKNQRPFPDLVFDCRFDLIFYYSFPCSLCFNHPFLHMCWHIPIFGPLFCCFLCLEFCPHRYSYGPMFISFRSLLRW